MRLLLNIKSFVYINGSMTNEFLSFDMKPLRGSAFGGLTVNGSYDGMIGELHQKVSSFISHDVTYIKCEKSHIWVLQFLFNSH